MDSSKIDKQKTGFKNRKNLYTLVKHSMIYASRGKILHKVLDVQRTIAGVLAIYLSCGCKVVVKDSKNGRAARWLQENRYLKYLKKCKKCKF